MKKILITIIIYVFTAKANAQTILMQETFGNGALPTGWSIDSAGVAPVNGWKFINPNFSFSGTGIDSKFAWINLADPYDPVYDCNLTSSAFLTIGVNDLYIGFSERFWSSVDSTPVEYARQTIEFSIDNGMSWQNLYSNIQLHGYPFVRNVIRFPASAIGNTLVKVRFNFKGVETGGWAIDSIVIADSIPCTLPVDTGLAVASTGNFVCPGQPFQLSIAALSRGAGQTYQWQSKIGAASYTNISGAVYDTLTSTQNQATYYRCQITCQSQTDHSGELLLADKPDQYTVKGKGIEICPGGNDTLVLTNLPPNHPPFVYQWQSANYPSGTNMNNIPLNSTDSIYVVDGTLCSAATDFRCMVGCASGTTATATTIESLSINPNTLCYCLPIHGNNCPFSGLYVNYVEVLGTPLSTNLWCVLQPYPHPTPYQFISPGANTTATLLRNAQYTLALGLRDTQQMGVTFAPFMWIDHNRNGLFEVTEQDFMGLHLSNDTINYNFYVPATATPGLTGMRIRAFFYTVPQNPLNAACETVQGGSAVDFLVTIDTTVGIAQVAYDKYSLYLFPNPAKDVLTITATNFAPTNNPQLIITDLAGRILQQEIFTGTATINTTALTPAVYFVTVKGKERSVVRRFVKAP
ncbi:MAG: T9SS type A sorting domain-containing protein [Bacteroidetes bacterium]|nr:T9SS type A sorting domain-containing protein [Bacteroidota bacterium]